MVSLPSWESTTLSKRAVSILHTSYSNYHLERSMNSLSKNNDSIRSTPNLDPLLAPLSRMELQNLIRYVVIQQPKSKDSWERELAYYREPIHPTKQGMYWVPVDPTPIRGKVVQLLEAGQHMPNIGQALESIGEIVQLMEGFLEREDARNAIVIVEAITRTYLEHWTFLNRGNGECFAFFRVLDLAWAEALLSADLSFAEQKEWSEKFYEWSRQLDQEFVDYPFAVTLLALRQGWDDPALQRVFVGEISAIGAWDDEVPLHADDLAQVRLRVLKRQGRYEEYINFAMAEGQTKEFLVMLVQQGYLRQAVDEGLQWMYSAEQALALAQALLSHNAKEAAMQIVKHGLTLREPGRAELGYWAMEKAVEWGQRNLAIKAALFAFRARPSLDAYKKLQIWVDEREWTKTREVLLSSLSIHGVRFADGQIDVYLYEDLEGEAVELANGLGSFEFPVIAQVMEAVQKTHSHWVIQNACSRANNILESAHSHYYPQAIQWLQIAQRVSKEKHLIRKWKSYHAALLHRYGHHQELRTLLEHL